jgi:hypothetical protein
MTDADLRNKLVESEDLIRQLVTKLQETVSENDRLRALVANLTEGATAHQTLQSLYRNADLPESLRAKCAAASLPHEVPRLLPEKAAIDASCEEVIEPLADVVARQRARADRMQREAQNIQVLPNGQVLLLDERNGGNGDDSDQ